MVYPVSAEPARIKPIQIPFFGHIGTDINGYLSLSKFQQNLLLLRDQTVYLDWQQLSHLDANLSALLLALINQARDKNNLRFQLDNQSLASRQNVFVRNGLAASILNTTCTQDERLSTVPVKRFKIDEDDSFSKYIQEDMFCHPRLNSLPIETKQKIGSCFSELFCNVEIHSGTEDVYVCGQFFPQRRELRFTMVDLGCGFLKNIARHTADTIGIISAEEAIKWAVQGNSTKTEAAGGSGLHNIIKHCVNTGDSVHISTDGCYCCYDPSVSSKIRFQPLDAYVPGTTIHMIFRHL